VVVKVSEAGLQEVVSHLLGSLRFADMSIEDPPLEDVMRALFARGAAASKQGTEAA